MKNMQMMIYGIVFAEGSFDQQRHPKRMWWRKVIILDVESTKIQRIKKNKSSFGPAKTKRLTKIEAEKIENLKHGDARENNFGGGRWAAI